MIIKKDISSSMEDYLETIYLFESEKQEARVGQIALHMDVKKSSVTEALQNLAKDGFVNYIPYSPITLTDKGKLAAEKILRKHNIVKKFFHEVLALSEEDASETACLVEHVISDEIASRFGVLNSQILEEKTFKDFISKLHNSF